MRRIIAYALISLIYTAALAMPLAFFWVVWPRGSVPAPLGPELPAPMLVNALVALLFPLQHTGWTQRPVKRLIARGLSEHFERPAYVVASGVGLLLTAYLWQPVGPALWKVPIAGLVALQALFVGSIIGQALCTRALGTRHMDGSLHLARWAAGEPVPAPRFREVFLYRWVRHPIAMCQLLMLVSFGTLRPDLALLAAIWAAWIVLATTLEERRLTEDHGSAYQAYKRRTGFLWPRFRR